MQRARRLIHLDVPWNPMDLEQRIGRIHRFGSRKTVLIDTVVAAGSREVDMYRVAREKLALIARHLDPDQFETLFSRVMSLVPPKELETILGDLSGTGILDGAATQEIGRLVTEGFRSWSAFDDRYRKQAEEIRSVSPGEARWADVGAFLIKYGGAENGTGASFNSFTFQENEIVAVDENVPTITFGKKLYACGDTGGLTAVSSDGLPVGILGLSLEEVQNVLRACFEPGPAAGVAYVKLPAGLAFLDDPKEPVTFLAFLRQHLFQERGLWKEKDLSLHVFLVKDGARPVELTGQQRAALIRAVQNVPRVKDPVGLLAGNTLVDSESSLIQHLRRPPEDEISAGIRYAVWPLAALVLIP